MDSEKNILIVDDSRLDRAVLGNIFRDSYHILEAENGAKALSLLEQYADKTAVVLLDLVMPVLDGFGVLEGMVARGWLGRVPVIMITAESSEAVMQKGYEMGAADIISKPFTPNIVWRRVHNVVEQYTYKTHLEQLVVQQTTALRTQTQRLQENSAQLINVLSAVIEFKNAESVGHIRHIRTLTRMLMTELSEQHQEYGITNELIDMVSEAAAVHDIGKVATPDEILNKPGRLTSSEFEIMKTHTLRGCEILEKLSSVQTLDYYAYCYEICRHHHERWDGNGYPDGLLGDQTPIWAQAVSLADVYDALTSKRVYKEAYFSETAVQMILNGACGAFNPVLLQCFLRIMPMLQNGVPELEGEEANGSVSSALISTPPNATQRDMPKLRNVERQVERIFFELSSELFFEYDLKSDQLSLSGRYRLLTGHPPIIPQLQLLLYDATIISAEDRQTLELWVRSVAHDVPTFPLALRLNLIHTGFLWYEITARPMWDPECPGNCTGYVGKINEIVSDRLEYLHTGPARAYDPLTGLFQRSHVEMQATAMMARGQDATTMLCLIDIDDLTLINARIGLLLGDKLLKRVAGSLRTCASGADLIGRYGGDKFLLVSQERTTANELKKRLGAICSKLNGHFYGCLVSVSVGAAYFPKDGVDFQSLLTAAEQALTQAKQMGKRRYAIYDGAQMAVLPLASQLQLDGGPVLAK